MTTITSNQVTVDVTQAQPTSISLVANPTTVNAGGSVTLTATVSPAISGISIEFSDFIGTQGQATTNSSGIATFEYTYPTTYTSSTDTWYATYNTLSSNPVTITINTAGQYSLSLSISPTDITVGQTATATATLTNSGSGNVSGVPITLTDLTTGTTQNASTNSSGTATFSITFTSAGSYNFQASATVS